MTNKIIISEKSLQKVSHSTLLEQAIYARERVALAGLDRLAFTAKCFIALESIGLGLMIASLIHLMA